MLFKNVLVPYDESEHAISALHVALGMVGDDPDAEVHVVTVVSIGAVPGPSIDSDTFGDPLASTTPLEYDSVMGAILHRVRADMQGVINDAKDGATCTVTPTAIIAGSPVEGIAEYVTSHDIDLVVMGRRGLGALRGMLGSVSYGVLRSVDVPVLTVK
ncbi:universal stress protein [Collinsella sp. An2]|uniref:universal stress protein n=1 Tax=Collinsella sp. An2 TaxID=1965585 RepID=UPI000B3A00A6|nr:universal stress protein [Collinsella sp. An2]OUP11077.1 hypothetical protein B5F33_01490 [Collinsella sp. An2]